MRVTRPKVKRRRVFRRATGLGVSAKCAVSELLERGAGMKCGGGVSILRRVWAHRNLQGNARGGDTS
jgi:hypothetical protein